MHPMSKCIICNLDININFKVSKTESQSQIGSTIDQDKNEDEQNKNANPNEILLDSQNNRIVFKTFCKYLKISSQEWEKLCDNFLFKAASKSSKCDEHGQGKTMTMKKKRKGINRVIKIEDTFESNDNDNDEEIDMDMDMKNSIPIPFCDDCSLLVKSLSELDKMLQMIQCEISKIFSNLLTIILTKKNDDGNKSNNNSHSSSQHHHQNEHHDIDEIFGSEIIRLKNCIYEQYTPRLILIDYSKYKSKPSAASEHVKNSTNNHNKVEPNSSHFPPVQNKRKRRSIRMRKTTSRFHTRRVAAADEIVQLDLDQDESSIINKTNNNNNNNNFGMENPESSHFMEIDDYYDEDPLFINQEEEEEQQQQQEEIQMLQNNEDKKVKVKIYSPEKSLQNIQPNVIKYSSSNPVLNHNLLTNIKIESVETNCAENSTTTFPVATLITTAEDCESPSKSRKAKNDALIKIKHKIQELSTLDFDVDLTLNKNKSNERDFSQVPQILDEIELDSDGEIVFDVDDDDHGNENDNGSEYGISYDENEEDEEEKEQDIKIDDEDWRISLGFSAAPKRKRGRPGGSKNKTNKNSNPDSDLNDDSQIPVIKRKSGRPPGAQNKRTIERQLKQKITGRNYNENDDNEDDEMTVEKPSILCHFKNKIYKKFKGENGKLFYKCCDCGFLTSWRSSLLYHIQVAHLDGNMECVFCRGGKYSPATFDRHLRQRHPDKKRKDVVIPCGPNLFYYNNKLFEKVEAGFKCLAYECNQIVPEFTSTSTTTTTTEIDEFNPNPEINSNLSNENNNSDSNENLVQNRKENESKLVEEPEKEKEQEKEKEELPLIRGTENIIEHINSFHIRKPNQNQNQSESGRSKSAKGKIQFPAICELCGKSFKSAKTFRLHINVTHSDARPYVCETCGLTFKSTTRLNRHQQIHNKGPELFVCTINGCGKKYTMMRYLTQHMTGDFHTEGKRHSCSICEKQGIIKKFHQLFSLRRHLRNHKNERQKNKLCPHCSKGFYTNSEVRQHLIRCPVLLGLVPEPNPSETDPPQQDTNNN